MQTEAPGSFAHSLQVGNLAEAAATEIGANPLLVKIGALYHDIGKIKQAYFYIENQKGENLHDTISDLESAKIIIDHVTEGIKMAKKAGLPKVIIDFIRTHHGTTKTEYFYRKYKEANPNENVDEKEFRYPGPLPYSRETAIVMLANLFAALNKRKKVLAMVKRQHAEKNT